MDTLQTLLGGSSTSSSNSFFDINNLLAPLMPFIILITIVSILIGIAYIINMVTIYRSHKATIETRDILREMNERDKARSLPPAASVEAQQPSYAATGSASSDA